MTTKIRLAATKNFKNLKNPCRHEITKGIADISIDNLARAKLNLTVLGLTRIADVSTFRSSESPNREKGQKRRNPQISKKRFSGERAES